LEVRVLASTYYQASIFVPSSLFIKMKEGNVTRKAKIGLEGHWARILDDFAESDCDVSQYCQKLKVSRASLYKWSQRLGVPLRKQRSLSKVPVADKEDMQQATSMGNGTPFSFIELNIPAPTSGGSCPVKLELLLDRGRLLKIEAAPSWEGLTSMIKALVS
jgi:hypothetical protein